jgi:hypothetical protein
VTALESSAILKQLQKINSHLQAQALEISAMRMELDSQSERISAMQAQLDVLPAIRRREAIGPPTPSSPPARNGNGAASKPAAIREGAGT